MSRGVSGIGAVGPAGDETVVMFDLWERRDDRDSLADGTLSTDVARISRVLMDVVLLIFVLFGAFILTARSWGGWSRSRGGGALRRKSAKLSSSSLWAFRPPDSISFSNSSSLSKSMAYGSFTRRCFLVGMGLSPVSKGALGADGPFCVRILARFVESSKPVRELYEEGTDFVVVDSACELGV